MGETLVAIDAGMDTVELLTEGFNDISIAFATLSTTAIERRQTSLDQKP